MPTQCCVPLCKVQGGHKFPLEPESLRDKWIQAVKRGEKGWKPTKWTVVCRNHFDEDDYPPTTKEGMCTCDLFIQLFIDKCMYVGQK